MASQPNYIGPQYDEVVVVDREARKLIFFKRANGQECFVEVTDARAAEIATELTS